MQLLIIQNKMARANLNLSEYMREVAVNGQVKARWTEEEREILRKLVGISIDINQLVETAKKEGAVQTTLYFKKYRDLIDETIKKLRDDR